MRFRRSLGLALLVALLGCVEAPIASFPSGGICPAGSDRDGDGILTELEGLADPDLDGIPNADDLDSDGDSIPDSLERVVDGGGEPSCFQLPTDTDADRLADFVDTDAAGDGIPDRDQVETDLDGDGIADWRDLDVDGDMIRNAIEHGRGDRPEDFDGDGLPDTVDLDSDDDGIFDRWEGENDPDGDGVPARHDLDSDGDGISDTDEAGERDAPGAAPLECALELGPETEARASDGAPDFVDTDSDNDGLLDAEELELGTDRCNPDTDEDGTGDLVEASYERIACDDPATSPACGCATRATCGLPSTDFFLVLPYGGEPQERELEFDTSIRSADVVVLSDASGSMSTWTSQIADLMTRPGGIVDSIVEVAPDAWFGKMDFCDIGGWPFDGPGWPTDDVPGAWCGGGHIVPMIPNDSRDVIRESIVFGSTGGGDDPEAITQGLYDLVTRPTTCAGRWGPVCFRPDAIQFVIHVSDTCSHNGPPGGDCGDYPAEVGAVSWEEMIRAVREREIRYIGVPVGAAFEYFARVTALALGSVDFEGNPLVFPTYGTDVGRAVQAAVEVALATTRLDVDTRLRDDGSDARMVDATRFVARVVPGCRASPPTDPCWLERPPLTHDEAVFGMDDSSFLSVAAGTRVRFRVTFQNDSVPSGERAEVFIAYIDVRGDARTILDTRRVFIVVPGRASGLG